MKFFKGKKYITLSEFTAAGGTFPAVFSGWSFGTGTGLFTAADAIKTRFADRYLVYPLGDAISSVDTPFSIAAKRLFLHWKPLVEGAAKMVSDLLADSEEETIENKRGANGGTSFTSAYSDGGTIRKRSGGSSGNVDRIVKAESDLDDMVGRFLDACGELFMPRDGWGG